MTQLYLFSLVLGGGFMVLSILGDLLGGADVADVDLDVDADVDLDADAGGGDAAFKILSLRTFVYALFGFGAVGTLLDRIWGPENPGLTAAFATTGGVVTGLLASAVFGFLKRSDSGERLGEGSFVGLTGKVTLPLDVGSPGQVSVFRGDRRYTLRALPHGSADSQDSAQWADIIVVEMDGGVARVIPVDHSLRLPPEE